MTNFGLLILAIWQSSRWRNLLSVADVDSIARQVNSHLSLATLANLHLFNHSLFNSIVSVPSSLNGNGVLKS